MQIHKTIAQEFFFHDLFESDGKKKPVLKDRLSYQILFPEQNLSFINRK